jgi:hypothetical protein
MIEVASAERKKILEDIDGFKTEADAWQKTLPK